MPDREDGAPSTAQHMVAGRQRKPRPKWMPEPALAIVGGLTIVSAILCYELKGIDVTLARIERDFDLFLSLVPRFAAAMIVAGMAQALVPREVVQRWLGEKSGFTGLVLATLLGAVMPGGPMVMFPMVIALANFGADYAVIIAFITSWELLAIQRILVWELPFLGQDIVALRVAISLPMPILAGLAARYLERHLGRRRAKEA